MSHAQLKLPTNLPAGHFNYSNTMLH